MYCLVYGKRFACLFTMMVAEGSLHELLIFVRLVVLICPLDAPKFTKTLSTWPYMIHMWGAGSRGVRSKIFEGENGLMILTAGEETIVFTLEQDK